MYYRFGGTGLSVRGDRGNTRSASFFMFCTSRPATSAPAPADADALDISAYRAVLQIS